MSLYENYKIGREEEVGKPYPTNMLNRPEQVNRYINIE